MHLLSTRPGGFVEDEGVVVRLDQTPAELVVLSSADTTLALLAAAQAALAAQGDAPTLRLANVMFLKQPASFDLYAEEVLQHASVVVVDHLGAESTWPYGIRRLGEIARQRGQQLAMFSGDLQEDENLLRKGSAPEAWSRTLWQYLRAGGPENARNFLRSLAFHGLHRGTEPQPPRALPPVALFAPGAASASGVATLDDVRAGWQAGAPVVCIVFYRSHLQSGNTGAFAALAEALRARGMNALPVALDSLKDPVCLATLRSLCADTGAALVLNTTAFAALPDAAAEPLAGDAPVLQVIVSGTSRDDWLADAQGLRPRDIAMQVALPEVDGRIITRAISFKGLAWRCALTQTDVVAYQPDAERIAFVAELARRWCVLRTRPAAEKRLALILANYPGSEGRLGSGVGLDTPASVIAILRLLEASGHRVSDVPEDGDALMRTLQQGIANDPLQWPLRPAWQSLPMADYETHLATLPDGMAAAINARWGPPARDPLVRNGRFMVAGLRCGQVFIGIQPARTHGDDATYASYHDAELVPPHGYLAFYLWLRQRFAVDAVVHVGKHGNLEWLPGKSLALSAACWPDAVLGPMPHLYPFIVNDPGEGAQAKRRTQAVIVDHLMPPLTRAESHGPLQDLERQVDEYYDALLVDARRAVVLRAQILAAVRRERLHEELDAPAGDEDALLARVDAYLCELKETQIRDGLHVFGSSPEGRLRRDTLLAIARYPADDGLGANAGLTQALANDLLAPAGARSAGFDPLDIDPAAPWAGARPERLAALDAGAWRHQGDTRERLELLALALLDGAPATGLPQAGLVLDRIARDIAPRLDACGSEELRQLARGLQGRFVPPGPSGSPSRGRPDVLPTGRNFHAVDPRAIPTLTAYELGVKSAAMLLDRHLQDHGDYPRAVGLSVWGTATMRTGGDDLAQAFALLGVRPRWAAGSHRVVDIEVLPAAVLGRPRIDVMLRISGFFRDAFPTAVQLFDTAVQAVARQEDEDAEQNPVRARILAECAALVAAGMPDDTARTQAGWRVFGSPPGHYGSGLQPLFDHGHWQTDGDLSDAYVNWSAHAYGQSGDGVPAGEALVRRLRDIDVVAQNQDSREHDLLDSNDYYQFQGGMAAAVRHLSGAQPAMYHGDHANPRAPRIRTLKEEVARVVRARVVNPKWMDGARRHGYKGAFEMAATVDYLFGFDATARVVGDHQYAMVADAYVLDDANRAFLQAHNPRALDDIVSRLLEAVQRGLWQQPGAHRAALEALWLDHQNQFEGPIP